MYTDPVSVHSITNCFHCCGILYIDNKKLFFFFFFKYNEYRLCISSLISSVNFFHYDNLKIETIYKARKANAEVHKIYGQAKIYFPSLAHACFAQEIKIVSQNFKGSWE